MILRTVPSMSNSMTACAAADGLELAGEIRIALGLLGDVARVLDDLERLAIGVGDRVVRRLDPHLAAALGDALVGADVDFAAIQLGPEGAVLALPAAKPAPTNMLWCLPTTSGARVTHDAREVLVDLAHRAVHVELDDGLRAADGRDLAARVGILLITRTQRALHFGERAQQLAGLVAAARVDDIVESALLDGIGHAARHVAAA